MDFKEKNKKLIEELKREGIIDKKILDAIENTPRHLFVRKEHLSEAYNNYPLPIGNEATISQPYTVAFMLEKIELKKGLKVLEIGTGSGWNAALIAEIIKPGKIYTTEITTSLVKFAKENIKKIKIKNIKIIRAKEIGYKKEALYDRIIVTAASKNIPEELLNQLKNNGIMLIPVGEYSQKMLKIRKLKDKIKTEDLGGFMFVPLR
ncbi:MAG: protein-L-isoaspartate(D-aspartate) O-methyltransferase [Nanoarchaeota archaeon]